MTITNQLRGELGPIVCIGGANIDRKFYVKNEIIPETSNPATSSASVGGVARNFAENLGRLGEEVIFISAAGEDLEWKIIAEASAPFMNVEHVEKINNKATGSYTAVLTHSRELAIALADMDIFDELTPEVLKRKEHILQQAACIVADLNCPKQTIDYLSQFALERHIPFIIIPVSSPKMERMPESLEAVTWLIVNKDETESFLNTTISNQESWKEAVQKWLDLGVGHVVVTNGAAGVMFGNENGISYYPAIHTPEVIDVTGAGDSFCSGVIHSWLNGKDEDTIILSGLVNSHKTITSKHTVRTELSREQLQNDMEEVINGKIS